jgi:hypothetical protein
MFVENARVTFVSSMYGKAEDLPVAREAAALFQKALEERGVYYEIRVSKAGFPHP